MNGIDIAENILPNRKPYERTLYLLKCYKDLKTGKNIKERNSSVMLLMDRILEEIEDDRYIDIIKYVYIEGYTNEKTAELLGIDRRTLYRNKRRIIKRIAIIIYGDEALL